MTNQDLMSKITINEFIKVASKSWPQGHFREISDIDIIKSFYDQSFKEFHNEIDRVLDKYNPASWVRIAYIQLEFWTVELFKTYYEEKDITTSPYLFAPIGRYGWRYILEICLEKLLTSHQENFNSDRPKDEDINLIFTYIIGLSYSSEISNYIHFFKKYFKNPKIIFSNSLYSNIKNIDSENSFIKNMIEYLNEKVDYRLLPDFKYIENIELLKKINGVLYKHFNFTIEDVEKIFNLLINVICPKIGASNLIIPTDELILLLNDKSDMNVDKISDIIEFMFFDINHYSYEKRDFFKRSQNIRMLNFAGCKLTLNSNLKSIYDDKAAELDYIKSSKTHSIISFVMLEEWKQNLISRICFGQRSDLKNINSELNNDISKIEKYFHRNIFENAIKKLLFDRQLPCISLEKIDKEKIICGEIDALSIDKKNKILYIIEAKYTAPAKDAKAFNGVFSDHFKQKKYHQKFLKKIHWVENNLQSLSKIFDIPIDADYKIEKYFVTGSPNPVKFVVDEYIVLTFFEFYKLLIKKYGTN